MSGASRHDCGAALTFSPILSRADQVRARRAGEVEGRWTLCLYTLYAGCVCILIRGIFRTIEFGEGTGGGRGYLLEREAWCESRSRRCLLSSMELTSASTIPLRVPSDYGLETLPILICSYIFLVSYPGNYIPSDRSVRLHPEREVASGSIDEEKDLDSERKRRWYLAGLKR